MWASPSLIQSHSTFWVAFTYKSFLFESTDVVICSWVFGVFPESGYCEYIPCAARTIGRKAAIFSFVLFWVLVVFK